MENNPKFWSMVGDVVAAKLADHDTKVTSKRYDSLLTKLGDNTVEIDKVKSDVSILHESVKKFEEIKGFNDANEAKKQFDVINKHLVRINSELDKIKCETGIFRRKMAVELNLREQRDHAWSLRIKNYQQPFRKETISPHTVYRQLIFPVLQIALKKGLIEQLGDKMSDVIEYTHFLRHREGSIPTIIFRFLSRSHLFGFMTQKKETLDAINNMIANCTPAMNVSGYPLYRDRPVKCQHSMSRLNKSLETFLYSTNLVKRTKLSGQTLCAMLRDTNEWRRIENPYSTTFDGLFQTLDSADPKSFAGKTPLEIFVNTTPKDRNDFFNKKCPQFLVRESDLVPSYTGEVSVEKETAPPPPGANPLVEPSEDTAVTNVTVPKPQRKSPNGATVAVIEDETPWSDQADQADQPDLVNESDDTESDVVVNEANPAVTAENAGTNAADHAATLTGAPKDATNSVDSTAPAVPAAPENAAVNKRPGPGRPPKVASKATKPK
ncbi:MAG: hypothetical protein GY739_02245 [Mesoflavibacter sp.]|nr:hypothetical protein [Mesoflavibacter sp.]